MHFIKSIEEREEKKMPKKKINKTNQKANESSVSVHALSCVFRTLPTDKNKSKNESDFIFSALHAKIFASHSK